MKSGDIVELIEDTTFYKKGKKAYFIGRSNTNPNNIEIVWIGEEQAYKDGDIDEFPAKLFLNSGEFYEQWSNYTIISRPSYITLSVHFVMKKLK